MWEDPIVKETRELRDQYAAKFKHNIDEIFKDILQRQAASDRKRVSYPAGKSNSRKVA
jgi:hypothetical protein